MKKLFKLISLFKLVKALRGRSRHGYGHYGPRHHDTYPRYRSRSRLSGVLRALFGRRGYRPDGKGIDHGLPVP